MPKTMVLLFLLCFCPAFAQGPAVAMQWGVKIPMRDGVALNATVYRPQDQKEPLPVVFTFTPYVGDSYTDRAMYFAAHGYVFALVDVRGRGNSGGAFEPFLNEGRDGYDVVEWLARQPYTNGKVAMWGGSYAGFDQWTALKENPPHLATIVPAAAVHPGLDFPFTSGVGMTYLMQWLTFTSGTTGNASTFGNAAFWQEKSRQLFKEGVAFAQFDQQVGNPSPTFQAWLRHPMADAHWDATVPSAAQYGRMNLPILTITGHFDDDQPGALGYYKAHMDHGSAEGKAKHFLIIGPWDHPGTRTPMPEVGGLKFAPASVLDLNDLHRQWYDWTLKAGPKPAFLQKRVAYYVMGAEVWKYADSLEAIATDTLRFHLTSGGSAGDVFHSGTLTPTRTGAASDSWAYDPLRTAKALAEPDEASGTLVSQRLPLNLAGEGVVYHTDLLPEALELSGFAKLTLWLTMDVPDTDLGMELDEILADGTSITLTSQLLRARYRDSLRKEVPVPPGVPQKYVFDRTSFFSRRLAPNSRLRLVVFSPNVPGLEKNYNSGGNVAKETAKDARTAHITLLHEPGHESLLELPVVR